jgi:hypothetical protein
MKIDSVIKFTIRISQLSDISKMVSLSKAKRKLYEKAQPQFWRYAGEAGDKAQGKWFKELLEAENYVMFTAARHCEPQRALLYRSVDLVSKGLHVMAKER